jgi:hypothetical protein
MAMARFYQRDRRVEGQGHVAGCLRCDGMPEERNKAKPAHRGYGEKRQALHVGHIRMKWFDRQNRTLAFFAYELK